MAWNSERMQNKVKNMDVKVSRNCFIPKENVKFYVAYEQRCVVNDVKNKKKEGYPYADFKPIYHSSSCTLMY